MTTGIRRTYKHIVKCKLCKEVEEHYSSHKINHKIFCSKCISNKHLKDVKRRYHANHK